MGKGCVRFRRSKDLPLNLIGRKISLESLDAFIQRYGESRK